MILEFDIADVLTNSAVVTTTHVDLSLGGSGGNGYIDIEDIL